LTTKTPTTGILSAIDHYGGGGGCHTHLKKEQSGLRTTHIPIGLCIIDYQTGIMVILGWCVDSPEEKREGQGNCPAFWPQSTDMQLLPTAFLTPSLPGGTQTSKKSLSLLQSMAATHKCLPDLQYIVMGFFAWPKY
jgi:hypothetical protein